MSMPPTLQQNQQQHQLFPQQQPAAAVHRPTPYAAVIESTPTITTISAPIPTTLTLQLQLNKNAAAIAAIAALDAVVYKKHAKNYNNNKKKCSALLSLTAATAASNAASGDVVNFTASETDVATAAVEIPLDSVVYELATAL